MKSLSCHKLMYETFSCGHANVYFMVGTLSVIIYTLAMYSRKPIGAMLYLAYI